MVPCENNFAFIDSQNVHLSVLELGWQLDFQRFRYYLAEKYKVKKAYIFLGYLPKNENLYSYLRKSGYEIIFKNVVERGEETKGNVDAEMVLNTTIMIPQYDKAVIVSGDGDFYCLIEHLLKNNKFKRLIIPNRKKYSKLLWKFHPYTDFLNNLSDKLGHKNRGVASRTKP